MRTIYLDGKFFKVDEQIIDAFTPGSFRARGVFETMLGLDGVVMDAALHLKRLRQGLEVLRVRTPSVDPKVMTQVLSQSGLARARVRLMVWQAGRDVHVMATALPYKVPARKLYRAMFIKTDRAASDRLANVKSLDYEVFAKAYQSAKDKGYDEALLLNRKGHVFEASRSNIFWVKEGVIYTPPLSSGCLDGITRKLVIQQAKHLKSPVQEAYLTPEILKKSDTAFLTNSLMGIQEIDLQSLIRS